MRQKDRFVPFLDVLSLILLVLDSETLGSDGSPLYRMPRAPDGYPDLPRTVLHATCFLLFDYFLTSTYTAWKKGVPYSVCRPHALEGITQATKRVLR